MQDKTLSIDKLLLEKGLITPEQLTVAIQFQCRLPKGQERTLAEVLVEMEFVTEAQLKEALGERPPDEDVLVQMLIKNGFIQEQQLTEAAKARENQQEDKRLGTMILEMGYTTREMIETALKHYYLKQQSEQNAPPPLPQVPPQNTMPTQSNVASNQTEPEHLPLGQRLIRKGYINAEELQHALDYQQRLPRILHKPLGEILIMLGYLNQTQLEGVLNEKQAPVQLSLGDVLVKMGVIQQWQLSHAMSLIEQPEHAHKKLGMLLVELGYARRNELEAALKEHYDRQKKNK